MADSFATTPQHLATAPVRRKISLDWVFSSVALRNSFDTWGERKRFRHKLEDTLKTAPHLIEDIGLTRSEVEAEISKPFWRD